jgi:thiamine-phosphate pyrophosphorylase
VPEVRKQERFRDFRLYAVMDLKQPDPAILDKVDAVCRGGADIVQLRSKCLTDLEMVRLGLKVREIIHRHEKLFTINDRVDLALATGADGLHLGQDDLPVGTVRMICARAGVRLLIGKSTHSLEQAASASAEDVDYLSFGPIFSTPTKPHYQAVHTDLIEQVHRLTSIPVVVIGGINESTLDQVLKAGARRVAAVRALFEAEDPYEVAQRMRRKIDAKP